MNGNINRRAVAQTLIDNGHYYIDGLNGKEEQAAVEHCISCKSDEELVQDYLEAFKLDRKEHILSLEKPFLFSSNHLYRSIKKILNYHELLNEIQNITIKY